MRTFHLQRLAAVLCTFSCIGAIHTALADEPPVSLDTPGGDAWSFDKRVSGQLNAAKCDQVHVEGPAGSAVAIISGDRFAAEVPLRSGVNDVHALCKYNGDEVARSSPQRWLVRIDDKPRAWARVRVMGDSILMDAGRTQHAPGIAAPIAHYEWRARAGNSAPLVLASGSAALDTAPATTPSIQILSPTANGEYYVTLRVTDAMGRSDQSTAVFQVRNGKPREVDLSRHRPDWVRNAVLYGVAPFVFGTRGYDDVRERLREIAALGVSVIWLSPITAAPADDFGYAVTDHFRSRAEFGTERQLRALIDMAHAFGMRVIMDFVPNHFATAHRYYADATRNQQRSPYFEWLERDATGQATHYFDWAHLKNLDYDHPEVQNYMLEAFSYWVREFDVDGFRSDVSWGVRERAPEFWPRWREELKRIDPDLLLIAEASAQDGFYFIHGFDAAYDWTSQLGQWAWHDVFQGANLRPNLERLRAALISSTSGLPEPGMVLRFLNNNDTGARFITRYGLEQTRVAAAMLFTLPGLPLVYNGDEVGAQFEPYDEQPISWRDRHNLRDYYQQLIKLRRDLPSLRSSELKLVNTDRDDAVLAYVRDPEPGSHATAATCPDRDSVLVLLNFTREAIDARFTSPLPVDSIAQDGDMEDVLTGEQVAVAASKPIRLKPFAARILTCDRTPSSEVVGRRQDCSQSAQRKEKHCHAIANNR